MVLYKQYFIFFSVKPKEAEIKTAGVLASRALGSLSDIRSRLGPKVAEVSSTTQNTITTGSMKTKKSGIYTYTYNVIQHETLVRYFD